MYIKSRYTRFKISYFHWQKYRHKRRTVSLSSQNNVKLHLLFPSTKIDVAYFGCSILYPNNLHQFNQLYYYLFAALNALFSFLPVANSHVFIKRFVPFSSNIYKPATSPNRWKKFLFVATINRVTQL